MRYSLRTLLLLTILGPPALAGAWVVGRHYWAAHRVEIWEDVGGPGMIDDSFAGFSLFVDEEGNVWCEETRAADAEAEPQASNDAQSR